MKRILIVLFALILTACGTAPTGYTWCYQIGASDISPLLMTGTLSGDSINSSNGFIELEGDFNNPVSAIIAIIVQNPGSPLATSWSSDLWGGGDYANGAGTLPSGESTLYLTVSSTVYGGIGIGVGNAVNTEWTVESITIYGTGTNPYPRNDCPAPTATPPAATPTPGDGLTIPINSAFTSLNDWLAVLAPIILMIGMIPVALAVLAWFARQFRHLMGGS